MGGTAGSKKLFRWDDVIPIDPNGSQWIQMDPNGSQWIPMDPNGSQWILIY